MAPPRTTNQTGPISMETEEARMRQALGLRNGSGGQRVPQRREAEQRGRRFVKDGEVPVVVVNRDSLGDGAAPINRIAVAEAAMKSERLARDHAERALAEAQATIQQLQTKLAHAEMAHREVIAAERRGRESAEAALQDAIAAREAVEARLAERQAAAVAAPAREPRGKSVYKSALAMRGAPAQVARKPRDVVEDEQEPVQWWLPSYRAKGRKA